jgi:hypothetical protein
MFNRTRTIRACPFYIADAWIQGLGILPDLIHYLRRALAVIAADNCAKSLNKVGILCNANSQRREFFRRSHWLRVERPLWPLGRAACGKRGENQPSPRLAFVCHAVFRILSRAFGFTQGAKLQDERGLQDIAKLPPLLRKCHYQRAAPRRHRPLLRTTASRPGTRHLNDTTSPSRQMSVTISSPG